MEGGDGDDLGGTAGKGLFGMVARGQRGEPSDVLLNWMEAQEFCMRLSKKTGRKYVLPIEAQLEYAARGGNKSKRHKYAGSNNIDEVAWNREDGDYFESEQPDYDIQPVGMKKANELGIYDMSGDVREWCSDWCGDYDGNDTVNPQGPIKGEYRVARGGDWCGESWFCRVSSRSCALPDCIQDDLGFRVVCIL